MTEKGKKKVGKKEKGLGFRFTGQLACAHANNRNSEREQDERFNQSIVVTICSQKLNFKHLKGSFEKKINI